jgi:hypothetical protein
MSDLLLFSYIVLGAGVYTGLCIWCGFIAGRLTRESDLKQYIMPQSSPVPIDRKAPWFEEDPYEEAMLPPDGERIPTVRGTK